MSKPIEIDSSNSRIPRNFIDSDKISKHLTCTICRDIFYEPNRVGCGHTFCSECIIEWMNSSGLCPICRNKINKNCISKDLVASNIINDLEVTCNNDLCPWKGTVYELERHMNFCLFDKNKLSDEIKIILSKDSTGKTSYESENSNYLNFNSQSSLKARLYEKNPELMINSLKKPEIKEISVLDLLELSTSDKDVVLPNSNQIPKVTNEEVVELYDLEEENNNLSPNIYNSNMFPHNISSDSKAQNDFKKEIKEKNKKKLVKQKKMNYKPRYIRAEAFGSISLEGEPSNEEEENLQLELAIKKSLNTENINN